ncbi:hypothetical protein J6590_034915 [Homalodisca vitripennis]|nr:hypothetical protein J6590_034915 [Homalodisca vitripennis]
MSLFSDDKALLNRIFLLYTFSEAAKVFTVCAWRQQVAVKLLGAFTVHRNITVVQFRDFSLQLQVVDLVDVGNLGGVRQQTERVNILQCVQYGHVTVSSCVINSFEHIKSLCKNGAKHRKRKQKVIYKLKICGERDPDLLDPLAGYALVAGDPKKVGDEERRSSKRTPPPPASFRDQRHPYYEKLCNVGEEVFSLSHQVHNRVHYDEDPKEWWSNRIFYT